jgi:hypothetical protein
VDAPGASEIAGHKPGRHTELRRLGVAGLLTLADFAVVRGASNWHLVWATDMACMLAATADAVWVRLWARLHLRTRCRARQCERMLPRRKQWNRNVAFWRPPYGQLAATPEIPATGVAAGASVGSVASDVCVDAALHLQNAEDETTGSYWLALATPVAAMEQALDAWNAYRNALLPLAKARHILSTLSHGAERPCALAQAVACLGVHAHPCVGAGAGRGSLRARLSSGAAHTEVLLVEPAFLARLAEVAVTAVRWNATAAMPAEWTGCGAGPVVSIGHVPQCSPWLQGSSSSVAEGTARSFRGRTGRSVLPLVAYTWLSVLLFVVQRELSMDMPWNPSLVRYRTISSVIVLSDADQFNGKFAAEALNKHPRM